MLAVRVELGLNDGVSSGVKVRVPVGPSDESVGDFVSEPSRVSDCEVVPVLDLVRSLVLVCENVKLASFVGDGLRDIDSEYDVVSLWLADDDFSDVTSGV